MTTHEKGVLGVGLDRTERIGLVFVAKCNNDLDS